MKRIDLIVTGLLFFLVLFIFFKGISLHFFQDDFINMYIGWIQSPGDIKTLVTSFQTYPYNAFRPIPYYLYGFLIINVFKLDPVITHLLMFVTHVINALLLFLLLTKLGLQRRISWIISMIYTLSPVHMGALYWWSGHYVTIGTTFFLLSLYTYTSYVQKKSIKLVLVTCVLFICMLFSNESLLLAPFVYTVISKIKKRPIPKIFVATVCLISIASFIFRSVISKFSELPDYTIGNIQEFFETAKWYGFRIVNLPEGVQNMQQSAKITIYILILCMGVLCVYTLIQERNRLKSPFIFLGVSIFVTTMAPFFLLPNHLSSYYLSTGFIGISIIAGYILGYAFISNKIFIKSISCIIFLLFFITSFISVDFMNKTSWIVWRSENARKYIQKLKKSYPSLPKGSTVRFAGTIVTPGELNVALYNDKGVRLYYNDKTISVLYGEKGNKKNTVTVSDY